MKNLWFESALLPEGWAAKVRIGVDRAGLIAKVERDVPCTSDDEAHRIALPGLANLHSHAFQRVMAGRAEIRSANADDDNFWTWRDLMYRIVDRISPDDVEAIAAMVFAEALETGFTRIGEFHYLHHDTSGRHYDDVAEMAVAVAAAAEQAGIALTLLPVFYAHSNFGGAAPNEGQRRFISNLDTFAALLEASGRAVASLPDSVVGLAPHSLRAVTPEELSQLLALRPGVPIHIHIAEQRKEVEACLAWSGRRPVQWLMENAAVDDRWCLVHATHVTDEEIAAVAASRAVVGLCPITEANLGDGIFPAPEFIGQGGRIGVGSDSNVRINAAEELRLLEYGQRLKHEGRNILAVGGGSTGRALFDRTAAGGAQALGALNASLTVGAPADIVELDLGEPSPKFGDQALDSWIFTAGNDAIATVWRRGEPVVVAGRHIRKDRIRERFLAAMSHILA